MLGFVAKPRPSAGARKLSSKGTQTEIAARVGVTQQAVQRWLSGKGKPSGEKVLAIEREYGIPAKDWYPPVTNRAGKAA